MSNVNPQTDHGRRPESKATPIATPGTDGAPWTDSELITSLAQGSHAALAEIYERYGTNVHRVAQRLRGFDAADDIVQDVFLRLWQRPDSFDPARGSLRSFLLMQTHGRCVDLVRSDSARRTRENAIAVEQPPHHPAVDDAALAHLAGEHAWSLLAGLSEGERSAIMLAYFGGHTYRQIAALLAQPEGTIKSRMRSGLTRLRHQMATATADSRPSHGATP